MKEEKNKQLEEAFRGYFAGAEEPNVDLSAAKAEVSASARRSARKRNIFAVAISACACIIVLAIALPFLFPAAHNSFTIAEADARTVGYTELGELDRLTADTFAPFSLSQSASAEYTVYSSDGQDVLVEARLGALGGGQMIKATVRVGIAKDFRLEELDSYSKLPDRRLGYRYSTEYLNGEYVSQAYCENLGRIWYIDALSSNRDGLDALMKILFG